MGTTQVHTQVLNTASPSFRSARTLPGAPRASPARHASGRISATCLIARATAANSRAGSDSACLHGTPRSSRLGRIALLAVASRMRFYPDRFLRARALMHSKSRPHRDVKLAPYFRRSPPLRTVIRLGPTCIISRSHRSQFWIARTHTPGNTVISTHALLHACCCAHAAPLPSPLAHCAFAAAARHPALLHSPSVTSFAALKNTSPAPSRIKFVRGSVTGPLIIYRVAARARGALIRALDNAGTHCGPPHCARRLCRP